ncbi:helix-turn-helix domain-containing protein [Cryobacterium sp. MDB2-A-1]|uniref:helix-turn-helix domain-containing protein n=1 Tax=unclassified Cryobacterium TaxID=2649013 RepID=UPI0035111820
MGNTLQRIGYSFTDAAKAAGVRKQDIARAIKTGKLLAHRIDNAVVILGTDIQAWIESNPPENMTR